MKTLLGIAALLAAHASVPSFAGECVERFNVIVDVKTDGAANLFNALTAIESHKDFSDTLVHPATSKMREFVVGLHFTFRDTVSPNCAPVWKTWQHEVTALIASLKGVTRMPKSPPDLVWVLRGWQPKRVLVQSARTLKDSSFHAVLKAMLEDDSPMLGTWAVRTDKKDKIDFKTNCWYPPTSSEKECTDWVESVNKL